jgi:hypothetical protein
VKENGDKTERSYNQLCGQIRVEYRDLLEEEKNEKKKAISEVGCRGIRKCWL